MNLIDISFAVDQGLNLSNKMGLFYATDNPTTPPGAEAPVGSIIFQVPLSGEPQIWKKFGSSDTHWKKLQTKTHYSSSDPTVDNDEVDTAGLGATFEVGDIWVNYSSFKIWFCCDVTTHTAIWKYPMKRVEPSVVGNFLTFSSVTGDVQDSGYDAGDFQPLLTNPVTGTGTDEQVAIFNGGIGALTTIEGRTTNTAFNANYEINALNITMNGVAAAGSLGTVADGGHVHPTDTSRQPLLTNPVTGTGLNGQVALFSGGSGTLTTIAGTAVASAFNCAFENNALNITMNGVASAGSLGTVADGGHCHPTDTSRQAALTNPVTGTGTDEQVAVFNGGIGSISTIEGRNSLNISDATTIYNAITPNKLIGFSALNITAANTRTISMADRDIDLDYLARYFSAGVYTFPSFTDNGGGSITVGSDGVYLLHTGTTWDGEQLHKFISVTGGTFALTTGVVSYIVVTNTAGVATMSVTTNVLDIQLSNVIPIWTIFNNAGELHKLSWALAVGAIDKHSLRTVRTNRFANEASSLILSEAATNVAVVSSGRAWYGITNLVLNQVRSDTVGACRQFYHSAPGVWAYTDELAYNNMKYDDGTGGLKNVSPGNYVVNWVYRCLGEGYDRIMLILGSADYNLADAKASTAQAPPTFFGSFAILVGRIIVLRGASTATQIDSAFTTTFAGSVVTTHNTLGGIDGGTVGEYYHFTYAQWIDLIAGFTGTGKIVREDSATLVHPTVDYMTITTGALNDSDAVRKDYVDAFFPVEENNMFLNPVSTWDATTLQHGFLPTLSGVATQYLNGLGNWATPTAASANDYSITSFNLQTSVNVVHNFGSYPIVQIINASSAVEIPYSIVHNTVNDFTVTFNTATTGNIIASMGSPQPQHYQAITTDYIFTTSDRIIKLTASGKTITMYDATGQTGMEAIIDNASSGDIYVEGHSGQLIENEVTQTIPPDSAIRMYCDGVGWRIY